MIDFDGKKRSLGQGEFVLAAGLVSTDRRRIDEFQRKFLFQQIQKHPVFKSLVFVWEAFLR